MGQEWNAKYLFHDFDLNVRVAASCWKSLRKLPARTRTVEGTLRDLLTSILVKHIPKDKAKNLLVQTLTFNQQLNCLYPLILGLLNLPPLPDDIRGKVNALANARNAIAHGVGEEPDLSFKDAADGLTASLFAFKHMVCVGRLLADQSQVS